ncbi:hypothetical protein [Aestuariimicrobium sp. T2.26MG-19.2B]|uniref:hypothetical protein n=1 Tax=Aestuariimicrobium sp. T2.26MG-19.2B TaxID=3040679 RepID=UPI0024776C0D|nr:hypothetical protein [Aestuariimicrobium sp. T2.26MG-19.2B]CAI9398562.1 hypothetical protein AESSP_00015 [Aestuariimicrobium sp. T2.26MG-19.2B]
MDIFTWTVIATVVLSLLCVGGAVHSHLRGLGPRPVLRWSAFALVPVGLLVTGAMRPVVIGAQAVGQYFQHATMTLAMMIGLGVLAVAVLMFIAGGRLNPRTRQEAKQVRQSRRPSAGVKGAGPTKAVAARGSAGQAAAPVPQQRRSSAPVDDEMAEIEALLKKRGIE